MAGVNASSIEDGVERAEIAASSQQGVVISHACIDRDIKERLGPDVAQEIRNGFIRKVYSILTLMLLLTTLVALPFQFLSMDLLVKHRFILQGLMIGSLVLALVMTCCCMNAMKTFPGNYAFLLIFSILYGVICGCVSAFYTLPSVLLAAGVTAGIFILLTMYAFTTTTDFTGMGPYLMAALFGLIMFGFSAMIFSWIWPGTYSILNTIYGCLGAILFSFYIVYDTQLIVGGTHKKNQFSIDDYAFAALNLYMDIINLFLMLLSLLGGRK